MEKSIAAIYGRLVDPAQRISTAAATRYVYMLFSNGEVVYVGFTSQIGQRIGSHKSGYTGIEFDSYSFVAFTDHAAALNAERELILSLRPKYNKVVAQSEYTGTPETNKAERAAKAKEVSARRAERMERSRQASADWYASLSPERRAYHDELTRQMAENNANSKDQE